MSEEDTKRGHEYLVYDELFRKSEFLRAEFNLTLTQISGLLDTLALNYKDKNLTDIEVPEEEAEEHEDGGVEIS